MDFISVFKFILKAFRSERIDFALIGGFGLQAVGIARSTGDIDLLILKEDSVKVKDIMLGAGYELIHESADVLNFISKDAELGRVDFLLAHRKYALAMLKRAQVREVLRGEFKIKALKIEDQIGLKVQSSSNDPGRLYRDMADIELLIKDNYHNLDLSVLREYFALFDREKELGRIIKRITDVK